MLSFQSDYIEGAHPKILERLIETNFEPTAGYGSDRFCEQAKQKLRALCQAPDADVYFLVGGTQTNQTVIDATLKLYEGVISAESGHIEGHEAGAIEANGHKVLTVPHKNGKIEADVLRRFLENYFADENREHMVCPGMVYISHPTEYGTLYTLRELTAISALCRQYGLPLFLDGARLGYGLMSEDTDVTLPDLARLCDVFYIGGTKVGALCGEAVVFPRAGAPKHFMTIMKRHGALMAKGRLLGVQFDVLFEDGLYFEISRHAIVLADRLRRALREKGYEFFIETTTNQLFIVLENSRMEELRQSVNFGFWERVDDTHTVVRFATSWATTEEAVDALIQLL